MMISGGARCDGEGLSHRVSDETKARQGRSNGKRQKTKLKILVFQNFTFLGVFACYTGQFCLKTKKKKTKISFAIAEKGKSCDSEIELSDL